MPSTTVRRFPTQFLAFLIGVKLVSAGEEKPFLTYNYQGGLSPYAAVRVTVAASGSAHAEIKKRTSSFDYEVMLSAEELSGLRAFVRTTDFFAQPERDSQFATDTGVTEITVTEPERQRTLKFNYRPELEPLSSFFWKLIMEAETFHDLNENALLPGSLSSDKILQPTRLKSSLIKFALSQTDLRKAQQAMGLLLPLITPEEFAGLIGEVQKRNQVSGAFLAFVGKDPPQYSGVLCPLYLQFVKENYPRRNEFSQWESELFSSAIGTLVNAHYPPAIPLFLAWFENSTGPTMSGPWTSLSNFGSAGTRALIPMLESKDPHHRQQAIELLLTNAKSNPQNRHPDLSVSEQEYDQMRELFSKKVLPKLKVMSQHEVSVELQNKAHYLGDEIESEINKRPVPVPPIPLPPPKFHGPFVTLSVGPDHTLDRTILEPEADPLNWVIVRDGRIVLQRNARSETQFKFPDDRPGMYTAYLTTFIDGAYRVISNVVFYRTEKTPASKATPRNKAL